MEYDEVYKGRHYPGFLGDIESFGINTNTKVVLKNKRISILEGFANSILGKCLLLKKREKISPEKLEISGEILARGVIRTGMIS